MELDGAKDGVGEAGRPAFGDGKANGGWFSGGDAGLGNVGGNLPAAAVVHGRAAGCSGLLAALFQFIFGAETGVSVAAGDHSGCRGLVEVEALRLEKRALVPIEAKPAHAFENALDHGFRGAIDVSILNAQDECPTGVAGKKPVEEGCARPAYVQVAGG